MGYLKGVGRIYQQTVVDTFSSITFAKVYTTKIPVTAADLLNDRALSFFEDHEIPVLRVLTDRGDRVLRGYGQTSLRALSAAQ